MVPTQLTDNVLNATLAAFTAALNGYLPLLIIWGTRVLGAITFVGFGYAVIQAVSNQDWYGTIMAFAWGVFRIALVYVVMANIENWGSAFPILGQTIGTDVSGQSPNVMNPSGVYELGLHIVSVMIQNYHFLNWFRHPFEDFEAHMISLATQTMWFSAACVYFTILLEAKWYVIKGPVTICFATFDHTWVILENWFVTLLQVGIRLIAVMVIIAIALILTGGWQAQIDALGLSFNKNPMQNALIQLVESMILLYSVWALPRKAAAIITSTFAHGVGAESSGIDERLASAAGKHTKRVWQARPR
jgi:type IV secretory pathway TrbL component